MGDSQGWLFEPSFNRSVKVLETDDRITSDAGLLLLREADHRLGITESLAQALRDPRRDDRIRYQLVELLRERIYALAAGYSAQDDADRLAHGCYYVLALMTFSGWIAVLAGWLVTEIGRQPYLVYGILTTAEAASQVPAANIALTLTGYFIVYVLLLISYLVVVTQLARSAAGTEPSEPATGELQPSGAVY